MVSAIIKRSDKCGRPLLPTSPPLDLTNSPAKSNPVYVSRTGLGWWAKKGAMQASGLDQDNLSPKTAKGGARIDNAVKARTEEIISHFGALKNR